MKRFLIISGVLFILALLAAVVVFVLINMQLPTYDSASGEKKVSPVTIEVDSENVPVSAVESSREDILLKEVPLNDNQKSVIEKVGVDVDSFVITAAMQTCAEEKLGVNRVNEIISGDAPDVIETAKLLSCTSAE